MIAAGLDAAGRERVLLLLAGRRGVDLRDHRVETIERGLEVRLRALACPGLEEYGRRLEEDPHELDRLLEALVVPFTSFFRDPPVFEALRGAVLPRLFAGTPPPLRVLCAGVATGEEAWSVAMLLADACGGAAPWPFEVIATDLDGGALEVARQGAYRAEALAAVPPALAQRYLESNRIAPVLQGHVRFARHDLMGRVLAPPEAVVASFALVLARNVLVYFDRRLQHKALDRLAAVIEPGGALVLGDGESLPEAFADRFIPHPGVDVRRRIYQRRERRA